MPDDRRKLRLAQLPITRKHLTSSEFTHPNRARLGTRAVVVHYVAAPLQSPFQTWNYFESLKHGRETYAASPDALPVNEDDGLAGDAPGGYSCGLAAELSGGPKKASVNWIVGPGAIIEALPISHESWCSGGARYTPLARSKLNSDPHRYSISIECNHVDAAGRMSGWTYGALVLLCAALCNEYGLNPETDLLTHGDVTGKNCHKWFRENPAAWARFKRDVAAKRFF